MAALRNFNVAVSHTAYILSVSVRETAKQKNTQLRAQTKNYLKTGQVGCYGTSGCTMDCAQSGQDAESCSGTPAAGQPLPCAGRHSARYGNWSELVARRWLWQVSEDVV